MPAGARIYTVPGSAVRKVALTALAFACLLAYCRIFSQGMLGSAFGLGGEVSAQLAGMCDEGRLLTLVVLMVLGSSRKRLFGRLLMTLASALMVLSALGMEFLVAQPLQGLFAFMAGVASGVCMFALMVLLSAQSFRSIAVSGLCGLCVGALLITCVAVAPRLFGEVVLIVAGAGCMVGLVAADPSMECYDDHGQLTRDELGRFPWFASVMVVVCGVVGSVLYQAATSLDWAVMTGSDYTFMGLVALGVILATSAVVVWVENWTQLVWVPLFALLACVLACACTSSGRMDAGGLALLYALVASFHFLSFVVVPAIVSTTLLPRYFANGVFAVVTNASFVLSLGGGAFSSLPTSLQTPSGLGGILALALAVVFAMVMLAERVGRAGEYEEPPVPAVQEHASTSATSVTAPTVASDAQEHGDAVAHDVSDHDTRQPLGIDECCALLADEFELTAREREIFAFTARGHSSRSIAEQLVISSSTVRFHQQNLYKKLEVHSKQELIALVEGRMA